MQLTLKNIGIIKEANITLGGLTVIAGLNDSGKSTIGKTIFSIIKSVNRYKEDLEEDKEKKIKRSVDGIYFSLRRRVAFSRDIHLRDMFYPTNFLNDILTQGEDAVHERIGLLKGLDLEIINKKLEKLLEVVSQSDNKEEAIQRAFKKIFYSEFEYEILNKHKNDNEKSIINIQEYENEILNIELTNFNNIEFNLSDELYFNDCTIIETPLVLNYSEAIGGAKSYFEIRDKKDRLNFLGFPNISFHVKDLDLKLKGSAYIENDNSLVKKIVETINGNVKFISSNNEFVYLKRDGKKYKAINTASGIKSFGILQMLINSGFVDERSLIVIDEPEVHLHPFWQLKYAEILTMLVKNNINILVTTHSPYMLEALEVYAKDLESNFYFAEQKKDGNVVMHNVSTKLDEIYKTLAEPFDYLEQYSLKEGFKW